MTFRVPTDLRFNRAPIDDPAAFAKDFGARSWLYLNGEEFASMPGGMSFAQVQAAVPQSVNVIADPPRELDQTKVAEMIAALDELPRPTLVTCRGGGRSSAVVYLYAGLRSGATADEVLAAADADDAPFVGNEEMRELIRHGLTSI